MLNQDFKELTNQLENISLEQANVIKHLEKINKAESNTLRKLRKQRQDHPPEVLAHLLHAILFVSIIAYATYTK